MDYAYSILDGNVLVCEDVRLACERFVRMLSLAENENNPYRFSTAKVEHILRFANTCEHVKGPDVGRPFILAPWQTFFICCVFGFVWRKNDLRVVSDVILFVPRKAGKTFLISLLCDYLLLWPNGYEGQPEGGTEIYVTAVDRTQAEVCFLGSVGLVAAMPKELASQYKIFKNTLHRADDRLSLFRTLSRDSRKNAVGRGATIHIIDEAAMVDRDSILAVDSGMIHRAAPLRISITTAHSHRDSLAFERMNYCSQILRGAAEENVTWFALMYSVPTDMNWDDPRAWFAVNPMLGVNVPLSVYENLAGQAKEMFSIRNEFLCRNLNYWVSSENAWMSQEAWDSCPHTKPAGEPDATVVGIDLAMTRDLNSVALLSRYGDRYWLEVKSFLPRDGMDHIPAHNMPVIEKAINDGHLILTSGNVTDYSAIYSYINKLCNENVVKAIGYDPFNASGLLLLIQENISVELQNVGQGMSSLSASAKELYQMVHEGRLGFEDVPFHSWCLSKCTLYQDVNSNWKVRKADPSDKIDPIVAALIALKCLMDRPIGLGGGVRFF